MRAALKEEAQSGGVFEASCPNRWASVRKRSFEYTPKWFIVALSGCYMAGATFIIVGEWTITEQWTMSEPVWPSGKALGW